MAETESDGGVEDAGEFLSLAGAQKTAAMMIALGESTKQLWEQFDDDELREVSVAMSSLGIVPARQIEALADEFVAMLSGKDNASFSGSYTQTQKLLSQFLPEDKVKYLMEEVRGPAGRTMWDKLSNVNEVLLANYLKNEYPQTVALILSKISSRHAARVLAVLPHDFAMDCVQRMLNMEPVKREVLDGIEETLRSEFMSNVVNTNRRDGHEAMADIFNAFDRETEGRFMSALETKRKPAAEKIRALMFVFEDLSKLDSGSVQTLLRAVDKDRLGLALKGANEELSDLFLSNMSERAAKLLKEDMNMMGPVKLKDVGGAQQEVVQVAKDLAESGEIMMADGGGDDELIY